jgi:hypothetical protein
MHSDKAFNQCAFIGKVRKCKYFLMHGYGTYCKFSKFYVVRTVHFGMKFYNEQSNAQVFNLFIYLLLPYMFRAFF